MSFAALTRSWGLVSGVITIVLVIKSLSPVLQGYYYGFFGLLVLQQFFQAGLSIVIQQFASHEWASLRIVDGSVIGDRSALGRLASLVRLARRGFSVTSVLVLGVLIAAGHLMFGGADVSGVAWTGPWYCLCLATAISMLVLPMAAILDGTGHVDSEQRAQLVGGVVGSICGWVALLAGMGLYSVAVIMGFRSMVVALALARPYRPFGRLRFVASQAPAIRWAELWPLQWRVSVSWLAGILMYQSMVPLTFALLGPVAAGQIGVLSQIFQAVVGLGNVWLMTAQPRLGRLAAGRRFEEIRWLTRITALRCSVTAALVGVAALLMVSAIEWVRPDVAARLGPPRLLLVLVLVAIAMEPQSVMVSAVRFQKKEPFVLVGLVGSSCAIAAMALGAATHGLAGVVVGFAAVAVVLVVPWNASIYFRDLAREEASGSVSRAEWQRHELDADPRNELPATRDAL